MAIISVSIDEETLEEADSAVGKLGFGSRSDVFRKGVKTLLAEMKADENLPANANAVLIVIHREAHEDEVTRLKHTFEEIVTMQTHSKLDDEHCLEIFVLKGEGKRISKLAGTFASNKKIKYSKLVRP
ncbi:MAG: CopG family ribbon-helix-helix protein [Candidatus Micrarchaeota archaeon]